MNCSSTSGGEARDRRVNGEVKWPINAEREESAWRRQARESYIEAGCTYWDRLSRPASKAAEPADQGARSGRWHGQGHGCSGTHRSLGEPDAARRTIVFNRNDTGAGRNL